MADDPLLVVEAAVAVAVEEPVLLPVVEAGLLDEKLMGLPVPVGSEVSEVGRVKPVVNVAMDRGMVMLTAGRIDGSSEASAARVMDRSEVRLRRRQRRRFILVGGCFDCWSGSV